MSRANDSKDAATKIAMPASLDACHALIEQLASTVDDLADPNETLRQEKEGIQVEFALFVQRVFARRSERYINDPNQLKLDLGDDDNAADAAEGLAKTTVPATSVSNAMITKPHSETVGTEPPTGWSRITSAVVTEGGSARTTVSLP